MQKMRFQPPLEIIRSDKFASMPATAQALYFHATTTCDKEGFTSQIMTSKFYSHASDEDLELLIKNGYIEPVENGPLDLPGYRLAQVNGR